MLVSLSVYMALGCINVYVFMHEHIYMHAYALLYIKYKTKHCKVSLLTLPS